MGVLVGLAALGAFPGDNLSYLVGRRLGPLTMRRFFSTEKGVNRRAWTERGPQVYGARLILARRVIPGERTASSAVSAALSRATVGPASSSP